MASLNPTVGRIVHFYNKAAPPDRNGSGAGPYAAIVTQVFPDVTYINLKVLPYGESWDEGSVSEKDALGKATRYWEWPPRS